MAGYSTTVGVTVSEEPYGRAEAAALVAALMADIDRRYEPEPTGGEAVVVPDARPAPQSAPPHDPAWDIDPAHVVRPHGTFVIARIGGRAVGCGALRPLPGGPCGIGEVKRMYTAPDARGRGVGRAVLDRLVVAADELGFTGLVLETGTRQPEAAALYHRAGWHSVVPYGEYADDTLSLCFGLDLAPPVL